jgi:hypothetical protein
MRGSVSASEAEEELDFLRPSFLPGAAEEDERRERGRFIYLLVSVSLVVADYQLLFSFHWSATKLPAVQIRHRAGIQGRHQQQSLTNSNTRIP